MDLVKRVLLLVARIADDLADASRVEVCAFGFACAHAVSALELQAGGPPPERWVAEAYSELALVLRSLLEGGFTEERLERLETCTAAFGLRLDPPDFEGIVEEADIDSVASLLYAAVAARSGDALYARYTAQRLMDAAYAIDLEHGQQTEQLGGAAMGRRVRQVERFLTMLVPQVRGMASGEGLAQRLELFVAENLLALGSE